MESKYFFDNDENWNLMLQKIKDWENTPYKHKTQVKGVGVDCTLLLGNLLLDCGVFKKLEYQEYPKTWYRDKENEVVLNNFFYHFNNCVNDGFGIERIYGNYGDENFPFIKIDKSNFKRGDLLSFSLVKNKVTNHAAIWLGKDNLFFNSIQNHGATFLTYGNWWSNYLTNVFRIVKN